MCFPRFRFSISRRGVRLGLSLLGGVCLSIPLLRCSSASADQLPYSLTANQTLALYGVNLPGYYYNGVGVEEIQFSYVGDTFSLHNKYDGQDGTLYYSTFVDDTGFLQPSTKIQYIDFLIYKWDSPASLAEPGSFDFQLRLTHSIDISATKFEEAVFWSNGSTAAISRTNSATASHYYVYGSSVDNVLSSQLGFRFSDRYSSYYGSSHFALNSIDLSGESHDWIHQSMYCQFVGSGCSIGSVADDADIITIGSSVLNIKAASTVTYPQSYDPDTGTYGDFSEPAVYLLIACPVVYGDYTLPDHGSGDDSSGDSGDITVNVDVDLSEVESDLDTIIQNQESMIDNQESANRYLDGIYTTQTAQLNDIIEKLDAIYNKMVADGDISVNFNTAIDNQTNALVAALGGLVTDIRGLFVPSSADIINFKADLEVLTGQTFLGIDDAETLRDQAYAQLLGVQPVETINFPLMNLSENTNVNFKLKPSDIDGLTVENGNIKVPVKPQESKFDFFYELAAWGIDIIATLLVVNMLLNKWKAIIVGEKVVEIE